MLRRLYVENFALLQKVDWEIAPGLNILTGETGAGKSILVDAIQVLLGKKPDRLMADRVVIEAYFAPVPEAIQEMMEEPVSELFLRREITPQRSRFFANDSPVSLGWIRQAAYHLIEIHSQHDTQQLYQPSFQLSLLDAYADQTDSVKAFTRLLHTYRTLQDSLRDLYAQIQKAQQEEEFLNHQLQLIEALAPHQEEYQELEKKIQLLQQAQEIHAQAAFFIDELFEKEGSVDEKLITLGRFLQKYDFFVQQREKLELVRENLAEIRAGLEEILSQIEMDPAEAARIQARYDAYNELLLRFRLTTVAQLLEKKQSYEHALSMLSVDREKIKTLEAQRTELEKLLMERAIQLELGRTVAAQALSDRVEAYLREVNMENARFHISIMREEDPQSPFLYEGKSVRLTPTGFNSVVYLLQANVGLPMAPLALVASGGELSRVMLALKAALAERIQMPTLILDEIDTGLSGDSAMRVGKLLENLAHAYQIIVITHLPQVASRQGTHFFIYKKVQQDRTFTHIDKLSPAQRTREIARLLSGDEKDPASLAAAESLMHK
ncbi:MAG: DNA repair protein RecN [Bacteroidia bacterium]